MFSLLPTNYDFRGENKPEINTIISKTTNKIMIIRMVTYYDNAMKDVRIEMSVYVKDKIKMRSF